MDYQTYIPVISDVVNRKPDISRGEIWDEVRGVFGELCFPSAFHKACDILEIPSLKEESNQAV